MQELPRCGRSQVIHRANPDRYADARGFFQTSKTGDERREPLLRGDAGIQQIVDKLQAAAIEGGKSERTRMLAHRIIRGAVTPEQQVKKLFDFFSDERECPYVLDPIDAQIAPSVAAAMRSQGVDCKGKAVLLAATIRSIGYDTRMVTADQQVGTPGPAADHHIYPEWQNPNTGAWEPVDAVLRTAYPTASVGDKLPEKRTTLWESPDEQ